MRPDSIAVALVLAAVVVLMLGSFATLATETVADTRSLAVVGLLVVTLLCASAFGARSSRRLENPYW